MSLRTSPLLVVLSLAVGCAPAESDGEGIYVGNPSMTALRLAPPAPNAEVDSATLDLGALELDRCEASEQAAGPTTFDLLGPERVSMRPGRLCGLTVQTDGVLSVTGTHRGGQPWALDLALDDVEIKIVGQLRNADSLDGDLILELGRPNWLQSELEDGSLPPTASPTTPESRDKSREVEQSARLFLDRDRDGWLQDDERGQGAIGAPGEGNGDR